MGLVRIFGTLEFSGLRETHENEPFPHSGEYLSKSNNDVCLYTSSAYENLVHAYFDDFMRDKTGYDFKFKFNEIDKYTYSTTNISEAIKEYCKIFDFTPDFLRYCDYFTISICDELVNCETEDVIKSFTSILVDLIKQNEVMLVNGIISISPNWCNEEYILDFKEVPAIKIIKNGKTIKTEELICK